MKSFLDRIFKNKNTKIISGIAFVMIATILARFLGFVREMTIAYKYGTSSYSDAFITSLSLPDLLLTGFASAITTLYIPLYLDAYERSKEDTKTFNSSVSVLLLTIACVFCTFYILFPEFFVKLIVNGFDSDTMNLTVKLSRIMILSCIPILISQHFKAYSQIKKKYAWALFFECIINVLIILGIFIFSNEKIINLSYVVIFANLLYSIVMFLFCLKNGFRYSSKLSFKSRYFKLLFKGVFPVLIANLALEINQIIDKNFASTLVSGTVSALNYSTKIINLITAILGTTLGTIFFPDFSKLANIGDKINLGRLLYRVNSWLLFFVVPIFFFVTIFSTDIITCIFGRGDFGETSIKLTTNCLIFYSLTIIGANLRAIWNRAYNASLNTIIPTISSIVSVIFNICLNFAFINILQEKGIALATSISSIVTVFFMIVLYKIINKEFYFSKFILDITKIVLASSLFLIMIPFNNVLRFNSWINLSIEICLFFTIFILYYVVCRFIRINAFRSNMKMLDVNPGVNDDLRSSIEEKKNVEENDSNEKIKY